MSYYGKPKDKTAKEQILTNVHYVKTAEIRKKTNHKKYIPTVVSKNVTLWEVSK